MTKEEIIRMAAHADREWDCDRDMFEWLETFAQLVAAAEREKVAQWQIGSGYSTGHGDTIEDLLVELEWQIREEEREACAKVCKDIAKRFAQGSVRQAAVADDCHDAIRARGQQ